MKIIFGIYTVFVFLFYTAFFTLKGDLLSGLYILPPLIISALSLITLLIMDVRDAKEKGRGKRYFTLLLNLNIPLVILSFVLPLVNGNRTLEQIYADPIFTTLGGVAMIFFTVPLLGYISGTVLDLILSEEKNMLEQKSKALPPQN